MALNSVEDVCNLALRGIGYNRPISDIYEGTPASRIALDVYGETRDELLRTEDWSFARRTLALTLVKGPPPVGGYNPVQPWTTAFPLPPWLFEYAYPLDAIEIRAVLGVPGAIPNLDPKDGLFRIDNDPTLVTGALGSGGSPIGSGNSQIGFGGTSSPAGQRVILTNIASAIAVYCARVTDPSIWDVGFVASLVAVLEKKFATQLARSLDLMKEKGAEASVITMGAERRRG